MKRVMIIGQPGSGKSTLARKLGEKTGLPVIHIDKIHWMPGWIERSQDEKKRLCEAVHLRSEWIFEGGHSRTWSQRLERCDTLIWLDFPLWLRAYRVFMRTLKDYGKSRIDLPENCPEHFSPEFYAYIWKTRKTSRDRMSKLFENAPPEKRCLRFRHTSEINTFMSALNTF